MKWNPNSNDFQQLKKTVENTTIGNTPTAALDLIGCGVERAISSGVPPTDLREVLETAITHAETVTGTNTGR